MLIRIQLFQEGDLVMVYLKNKKFGSCKIVKIGENAYIVDLPDYCF